MLTEVTLAQKYEAPNDPVRGENDFEIVYRWFISLAFFAIKVRLAYGIVVDIGDDLKAHHICIWRSVTEQSRHGHGLAFMVELMGHNMCKKCARKSPMNSSTPANSSLIWAMFKGSS
jgi:hypothetical protein